MSFPTDRSDLSLRELIELYFPKEEELKELKANEVSIETFESMLKPLGAACLAVSTIGVISPGSAILAITLVVCACFLAVFGYVCYLGSVNDEINGRLENCFEGAVKLPPLQLFEFLRQKGKYCTSLNFPREIEPGIEFDKFSAWMEPQLKSPELKALLKKSIKDLLPCHRISDLIFRLKALDKNIVIDNEEPLENEIEQKALVDININTAYKIIAEHLTVDPSKGRSKPITIVDIQLFHKAMLSCVHLAASDFGYTMGQIARVVGIGKNCSTWIFMSDTWIKPFFEMHDGFGPNYRAAS